jgi:hypothetical protein
MYFPSPTLRSSSSPPCFNLMSFGLACCTLAVILDRSGLFPR